MLNEEESMVLITMRVVPQTFEPEEEEDSAKGKSDIHELKETPKRKFVMELNNEIIEEEGRKAR